MANLGQAFDATQHDTEQKIEYSNLPNGVYELEIEASEIKPTKNGTGQILNTTLSVLRPAEFSGRKLFQSYNLVNASPVAQEIGLKQFASLCRSIGETNIEDSDELHFKAFVASIGLGKPSKDGKHPARAELKKYYFPDEGNAPEPAIDVEQPRVAANDNTQQPANDNAAPAQESKPAAAAGAKRSWGAK